MNFNFEVNSTCPEAVAALLVTSEVDADNFFGECGATGLRRLVARREPPKQARSTCGRWCRNGSGITDDVITVRIVFWRATVGTYTERLQRRELLGP